MNKYFSKFVLNSRAVILAWARIRLPLGYPLSDSGPCFARASQARQARMTVSHAPLVLLTICILINLPVAKPVDLQMGARSFGMGGAFTAIANDGTSAYWNPAGLAQLNNITFSETNWILTDVDNLNVNYLNSSFPIPNIGTISGGWLLQSATLEEGTGSQYNETDWSESSFSLSAGRRILDDLWILINPSVGFTLNRHLISAESDNGAGTGFDVGFLTLFPYGISFGFTAKSLATDMMGDKIEPEYRIGLGYFWIYSKHIVVVASDLLYKKNIEYQYQVVGVRKNLKGFLGIEYSFFHQEVMSTIRMGWNATTNSIRRTDRYSIGTGFGYSGIHLHYGYQWQYEDILSIGDSHRITLEIELQKLLELTGGD